MDSNSLSAVSRLARELAEREGFELVDVAGYGPGKRFHVQIVLHRLGGVTLNDCQRFSETLGTLLEVEEAISGPYVLEVSSPGLTRHLKSAADFRRAQGQEIEVSFITAEGAVAQASGRIVGVSGDAVTLDTAGGSTSVPLGSIRYAKPLIDWTQLFRAGERRSSGEKRHE